MVLFYLYIIFIFYQVLLGEEVTQTRAMTLHWSRNLRRGEALSEAYFYIYFYFIYNLFLFLLLLAVVPQPSAFAFYPHLTIFYLFIFSLSFFKIGRFY
jgi:hypothetical protein